MAQCGRRPCFAQRPCGVGHRLTGEAVYLLDGDLTLQLLVPAQPHRPHSALADGRPDAVPAADQVGLHRTPPWVVAAVVDIGQMTIRSTQPAEGYACPRHV